MRLRFSTRLILLAALASTTVRSQVSSEQIDVVFAPLKSNAAPGVAVLVVHNGKAVFRRGYGVADLRTLSAIDPSTNFRLASFSKQFTAMCIMLLVHDGKLHYGDHLTDVLTEFPAYGKAITIRNLLNHTSGLPDYEDIMAQQYPNAPDDQIPQIHNPAVLQLLEQQRAGIFPAGSKWQYSNSGYVVLAQIVERVSGEPFGRFLQQRIFTPLKMTNSLAYEKGKNEIPHRAYGHSREQSGFRETDQSSTSATLGDGGIYSSIDDLEKWDRALYAYTLLSKEEMQPAYVPVQPNAGPAASSDGPVSYGFGWHVESYGNHKRRWHDGETMGFRTTIQRFPDDGLTVIVLANRTDVDPKALALRVADLYLKK